ncbi:RNI-like protein [Gigaspora margarita]|uniref:RNI-like protein n=1 Tax=Gigaspora margarita TaxID=4874 RepID=A0A8H4A7A5_GIGMA|nr:RNI-like protein [Gigaspora margarita]
MIEKLPDECLLEIFNNLQEGSLFSCLLVNRHCCIINVPLLWKTAGNYLSKRSLIETCLLSLNTEEQALIPSQVILPNHPKPSFEYTNFITSISDRLNVGIVDWFNYYNRTVDYGVNVLRNAIRCSLITMSLRTSKNLIYLKTNGAIYEQIIKDLSRNNTIMIFELHNSNLNSKGTTILQDAIIQNTALTYLNLYNFTESTEDLCNSVADALCGKALGNALCKNVALTYLNLSENSIGSKGGKALAKAFYKNTTLNHLDIYYNYLGPEGGLALGKALNGNTTLISLDFDGNDIGTKAEMYLQKFSV